MYKPLPYGLTLKQSSIEGYGVFTDIDIEENTKLGLTHIVVDDEIHRTPFGGFLNHSNTPNTIKEKVDNKYYLYTLRDIKVGEELTLKYTFYNVEEQGFDKPCDTE